MGLEKKMKTGFNKLVLAITLLVFAAPVWAVGTVIAIGVLGFAVGSMAAAATAFAINMVVSAVISKAFQPSASDFPGSSFSPNPGNRQQIPPATDNKLPVVYGSAYVGGTITDLSITEDNQKLYYVLAIAEVTSTNTGQTPDTYTFGDVYYGGKKCIFDTAVDRREVVTGLLDESTGIIDTAVDGKINIYLFSNGSYSCVNFNQSAISIMSQSGLVYTWDTNKLMTNCAFAIVCLTYSQSANILGIQQTKFQITNSRTNTGDCFYDYLINERYGAAIPESQINTASLVALNAYSNENFTYTTYSGTTTTQPRFKFDGTIDTNRAILDNLQDMASCCDCLVKYNEVSGKWGVIVQTPTYSVAMNLNDSNMVSAISISPTDIAASYNVIECKFSDKTNQDAFNAATFDLAEIAPSLLYPNEPVNKLSISLPLVNNNVQAQYIANRTLKSAREDLIVQVDVNFVGIQLEAGDIVTITSANYGWTNKLFRLTKVIQVFGDDGSIVTKLSMSEFNPTVYDDVAITQFAPSPNTGIGSPLNFGAIPAPQATNNNPTAVDPFFLLTVTTPTSGIVQYAEIWYSAFQYPLDEQRIFAGTTTIQPSGNPYPANSAIPPVALNNIPAGNWYFFSRMVNSLGKSIYSPPSNLIQWRPQTYQFTERYLSVAYASSITGADFSLSPTNRTHFGLVNLSSANVILSPSEYKWYPALPEAFGTENFLIYSNRSNRKFTFAVDNAAYIDIGGNFIPTETSVYDPTLWSGLPNGNNSIDLDARTGQVTRVGTSSISTADGLLSVTNNTNGTMVVSLQKFLNFGNGIYSKNFSASTLTIDVYGRVIGFTESDDFFFTDSIFSATAGQTTFNVTHIVGQVLVFRDGILMPAAEYSETSTTIVLNNACAAGEIIEILNMRAVSTSANYISRGTTVASLGQTIDWVNNANSTITWTNNASATIGWKSSITYSDLPYVAFQAGDQVTFTNTGAPTVYTVASVDYTSKILTFTVNPSGISVGDIIYEYRAAGSNYAPFQRIVVPLSNANSFTPSEFTIRNGYEQIYVNGMQFNEIDYDLSGNTIAGFPAPVTGLMEIIIFAPNNLGIPCSNITNTVAYSVANALSYSFSNNPLAMQVYANGALLVKGSGYDYIPNASGYNLTTPFTNNFTLLNQQTFARIGAA